MGTCVFKPRAYPLYGSLEYAEVLEVVEPLEPSRDAAVPARQPPWRVCAAMPGFTNFGSRLGLTAVRGQDDGTAALAVERTGGALQTPLRSIG